MHSIFPAGGSTLAVLTVIALFASFTPSAQAATQNPLDDWATVLDRFVDDQGLVDYQGLSRDRAAFDRYVQWTEKTSLENSPELFPTRD